jgi:hypothetical protein
VPLSELVDVPVIALIPGRPSPFMSLFVAILGTHSGHFCERSPWRPVEKRAIYSYSRVPPIGLEPMRFGLKDAYFQGFCSGYKALSAPE